MPTTKLPLFVLGPDFMPMSSASLRVFEPRYKQMMDDCILDSKPFGYITYDPDAEDIGGWTQPAKYGVLVEIEDYEESVQHHDQHHLRQEVQVDPGNPTSSRQ